MTLKPHQESEVLQWLLSWGSHVRVLEPETLRQRILEEAQVMLQNHREILNYYVISITISKRDTIEYFGEQYWKDEGV